MVKSTKRNFQHNSQPQFVSNELLEQEIVSESSENPTWRLLKDVCGNRSYNKHF